jgi:TonB family protein
MPDHHNKKRFLNMPKYPGGSEAFKEFLASNLRFPAAALQAGVEGKVIVEYDVHDNGLVQHPRILKSVGYGCDEEALRIISMLRFEKVKNRGVRVKMTTKTTINFRLPVGMRIQYTSAVKDEPEDKSDPDKDKPGQVNYEYTISF